MQMDNTDPETARLTYVTQLQPIDQRTTTLLAALTPFIFEKNVVLDSDTVSKM